MYKPAHFDVQDRELIYTFIEEYPFATVITKDHEINPYPILVERGRGDTWGKFVGHLARANPHVESFGRGDEATVLINGPHAYVSPTLYGEPNHVPTWNFISVQATVRPRLIEDPTEILKNMTTRFESGRAQPWAYELPPEINARMLKAIVGFEMEIINLEAKFKLSQNRSQKAWQGVVDAFESGTENERAIALWMKKAKGLAKLN